MTESITLDMLKDELSFFNKMYDIVRIVDPIEKRVLEQRESENIISSSNEICYDYWESGAICDNCISIRAHHNKNSFMKLEVNPTHAMLVTAISVETNYRPVVLELLKNATDTMLIGNGVYNDGRKFVNVISKMNDLIVKDPLTDLYNRRFIDDRLPVEIVNATIEQKPLSILFVDIDNLKIINDTYGHVAGDTLIQKTGNILRNSIRVGNDWVARIGGDEFIVVLKNTSNTDAAIIVDRILDSLDDKKIIIDSIELSLSLSIGIHTMDDTKLTPEELISLADQNMYERKELKNKIINNINK